MELECLRKMADLWYHSIDALKLFQGIVEREIKKKQSYEVENLIIETEA